MPVQQNFRPGRPFVLPPSPARSTDSQFDARTPSKENTLIHMEETSGSSSPPPTFPFQSEAADVFVRPIIRPRRPPTKSEREPPQASQGEEQQKETIEDMWVIRRCDAFDEDDR